MNTDKDKVYNAIIEHQSTLVKRAIWQCCLNCLNFDKTKSICLTYKATPPPHIIVHGCRDWEDDIPF